MFFECLDALITQVFSESTPLLYNRLRLFDSGFFVCLAQFLLHKAESRPRKGQGGK